MNGSRVPVVLQLAASECGHACARMVLAAHGRTVRLSELRRALPIGRDGTSLRDISDLLRGYGLDARVEHLHPGAAAALQTPAILFWNRSHFVVLVGRTSGGATVIDPSVGRLTVDADEFRRSYSGACIRIAPGARSLRSPGDTTAANAHRALGERAAAVAALVPAAGVGLAAGSVPLSVSAVLSLRPSAAIGGIVALAAVLLLVVVLRALSSREAVRAQRREGAVLFRRLVALPLAYFDVRAPAELLARLSAGDAMRDIRSADGVGVAFAAGAAVGAAAATAAIFPAAAVAGIVAAAAGVGVVLVSAAVARNAGAEEAAAMRTSGAIAATAIGSIGAVKAQGLEGRVGDAWAAAYGRALDHRTRPRVLGAAVGVARLGLVLAAALIAGVVAPTAAVAAAIGAAIVVVAACDAVERLLRLRSLAHNRDAVADILDEASPGRRGHPTGVRADAIGAEGVGFTHAGARRPTLADVTFELASPARIAVVGPSGSGKSTLAQLLVGLREPTSGRILIDGHDLAEIPRGELASLIGYVPQSPIVISGSIRRNIDLERDGIDEGRVRRAAADAGILEEIESMPMGLDTVLTPNGAGLSGGQHQRIALARALAAAPRVLVLDEATSALDPEAEHAVIERIAASVPTLVIITHRPELAATADVVIALADGRVARRTPRRPATPRQEPSTLRTPREDRAREMEVASS